MIKRENKINQSKRDIPLQERVREKMMIRSISSTINSSLKDSYICKVKEEQIIVARPN